jgi:hypothetical protein
MVLSFRLREYYDWVVVGDDVGALLSAALVARLGLSVLVLGPNSIASPKLSKSGQLWEPESNVLTGLGSSGLLTRCLSQLGFSKAEQEQFSLLDPAYAVRTRDTAWVFPRSLKGLNQEVEREGAGRWFAWPREEQISMSSVQSLDYWKTLPERLTLSEQKSVNSKAPTPRGGLERAESILQLSAPMRASISEWARAHRLPPVREEFGDFLRGFAHAIGATPELTVSEWWALIALSPSVGTLGGGMTALRKIMLDAAIRNGAHRNDRADLKRIFVTHGRLVGIQVSQLAQPIRVGGAILGAGLGSFLSLLDTSGRNLFGGVRAVSQPSAWSLGFSAKLPARFRSEVDARRWVIAEGGDEPLELEWISEGATLMVRSRMPWNPDSLNEKTVLIRLRRMYERLLMEFPLVHADEITVFPDFLASSERVREVFPFGELEQIPPNLRCYDQTGVSELTGIEGLFVSSNEVRSEFGFFGKLITGVHATAWAAHRSGVAGPFG